MEEDYSRFRELYFKEVDGTITAEERQELMQMVESQKYLDHFPFIEAADRLKDSLSDEHLTKLPSFNQILLNVVGQKTKDNPLWFRIAASIVVLAVIGVSVFVIRRQKPDQVAAIPSTMQLIHGMRYFVLPDSSSVYLNAGSELEYPLNFGEASREVYLKGEGFFDVKHKDGNTFVVHSGDVTTTVLGTAFNVANAANGEIRVSVVRGKVQVKGLAGTTQLLERNEQAVFSKTHDQIALAPVISETVALWKEKILVLNDMSMLEAVEKIEARFKVEIDFESKEIENCTVHGVFYGDDPLDHVLEMICRAHKFAYRINNKGRYVLSGKGC